MSKKQAVVKRSNGNINITIENNLKAVQTNEPTRRRRRRKPKPTDIPKEEAAPLPPLKDVSYIKPPGNSFNVWRDTIDSYNTSIPIGQAQQMGLIMAPPPPAPPAPPLALPPPANNTFNIGNSEGSNGPSWRDFNNFMMSNRPTRRWNYGDNMLDDGLDDEEDTLQRAFVPQGPPRPEEIDEGPPIISDNVINAIPGLTDEQKAEIKVNNNILQAKKDGTRHGNAGIEPKGKYMDTPEYKENYNKAFELKQLQKKRDEKQAKLGKIAMYNLGKEEATAGKALRSNRNKKDVDYMRGYNEVIDAMPQEAGAAGS